VLEQTRRLPQVMSVAKKYDRLQYVFKALRIPRCQGAGLEGQLFLLRVTDLLLAEMRQITCN